MRKMKNAAAVAALMALTAPASAAEFDVTLTEVLLGSGFNTTSAILSGDLTGTYDDSTGIVTMDGTMIALVQINPFNDVFTHVHTDWSTGNGGYSASAYSCVEGNFGSAVGANICGGYNFGDDFVDDSIVDYSTIPGTRIILNDDVIVVDQQQGSDYASTEAFFDGSSLIMNSALWNDGTGNMGTEGVQLRFDAVPVQPPTVGGTATRISITTVRCKAQGQPVTIEVNGASDTWDCEAAGLDVQPGDNVEMRIIGIVE